MLNARGESNGDKVVECFVRILGGVIALWMNKFIVLALSICGR